MNISIDTEFKDIVSKMRGAGVNVKLETKGGLTTASLEYNNKTYISKVCTNFIPDVNRVVRELVKNFILEDFNKWLLDNKDLA